MLSSFFFFNDTATTEIYTLSLHDALPICGAAHPRGLRVLVRPLAPGRSAGPSRPGRSEEHTSELQSQSNLVCRLLLEKKKNNKTYNNTITEQISPTSHPTHSSHTSEHTEP